MTTYNAWEQYQIAENASLVLNDEDRKAWEVCKEALSVSKLSAGFKALDSDSMDVDIDLPNLRTANTMLATLFSQLASLLRQQFLQMFLKNLWKEPLKL